MKQPIVEEQKANELEKSADFFYKQLTKRESEIVKLMVNDIQRYMKKLNRRPFLIAGVGGVLRFELPGFAKDIDLAVAGLDYPGSSKVGHTFNDVEDFTGIVQKFFMEQVDVFKKSKYNLSQPTYSRGSGPFGGMNATIEGKLKGGSSIDLASNIESFGFYNSKGFQLKYNEARPVDIQFVFNEGPELWRLRQLTMQDRPRSSEGKDEKFFYSVLAEQL